VRDATGEPAECVHFLRLAQIIFELLALGFVALKSATHAVEGASDPCEFTSADGGKRVGVIALLKSANAFEEGAKRFCEVAGD